MSVALAALSVLLSRAPAAVDLPAGRPAPVASFAAQARTTAVSGGARILVMPFENTRRDGRLVWLGEASALLLADDLNDLGEAAVTREERLQAFERLQVPRAATLTDATVIRIGQLIGANQVVVGSLQLDADTLVVHARSIALETGRVLADVGERGAMLDLYAIYDRVARALTDRAGASNAIERPALAAFEQFIKGLLAETPSTAITYLDGAVRLQPNFDRARLAMWDVFTEQGEFEQALDTVKRVPATSPWAPRATFRAGLSQISLGKYDDAFGTFKTLNGERSTAAVLNNLGVVQLRRGSTRESALSSYYFKQASEADPTDSDYFFNLGYSFWMGRDTPAAVYWLREAARRSPADGEAHYGWEPLCQRQVTSSRRPVKKSWRSVCPPSSNNGTGVRRPTPCRKGSNDSRSTSSCRAFLDWSRP